MSGKAREVVVVGGGSSGIIAVHKLVDCFERLSEFSQSTGLNITLVEKEENSLAMGLPYRREAHICLLNHPVKHMSPFEDDKKHFLRWCILHGVTDLKGLLTTPETYHSRAVYGEYLKHLLAETEEKAEQLRARGIPVSINKVYDQIVDLEPAADKQYLLHPQSGGPPLQADFVVLALGHQASPPPRTMQNLPGYFHNPIDLVPRDENGPPPNFGSNVVVLGTGPSMLDAVRILEMDDNYFQHITLISNNGLTPWLNDTSDTCAYQKRFLTPENLKPPLTADQLIDLIGEEISSASNPAGTPPPLYPHTHALFGVPDTMPSEVLPPDELLMFAKKFGSRWMHYTTQPTAPDSYELIERLKQEGIISIVNGRVDLNLSEYRSGDLNPFKLHFTPAMIASLDGSEISAVIDASAVVNCLGIHGGVKNSTDPFVRKLLERGILHPNLLGSGCYVDHHCRVTDPEGKCHDNLFLLGPLGAPPLSGFGVPAFSRRITRMVDHIMETVITDAGRDNESVLIADRDKLICRTRPPAAPEHELALVR